MRVAEGWSMEGTARAKRVLVAVALLVVITLVADGMLCNGLSKGLVLERGCGRSVGV